ncbi:MAG: hypothetical protein NC452_14765 [Eubacterium sp.]|nr:hypothetical protein [Eubacterium sp.]
MSKKEKAIDYASELENSYKRWEELYIKGGSDPCWADGEGLWLVKNHIIHYKEQLTKQENSFFGLPDAYYRDLPPDVPRDYMARPDEIRENARKAMEIIEADENLKFVREQSKNLSAKQYDQLCIRYILGYAENIRTAIDKDDLITMRRYGNPERYLDSFRSAAEKIRSPEILRNIDEQPEIYESEDEESENIVEEEYSESEQSEAEENVESEEEQDEELQLRFF